MEYSRDTPPGSISFYVHGAPKGKGRPRFTQAGIAYTPDDTRIYEERVIAAYLEQVGTSKQRPYFPKDKPLVLEAVIDFAPPKSASKKEAANAGRRDQADQTPRCRQRAQGGRRQPQRARLPRRRPGSSK